MAYRIKESDHRKDQEKPGRVFGGGFSRKMTEQLCRWPGPRIRQPFRSSWAPPPWQGGEANRKGEPPRELIQSGPGKCANMIQESPREPAKRRPHLPMRVPPGRARQPKGVLSVSSVVSPQFWSALRSEPRPMNLPPLRGMPPSLAAIDDQRLRQQAQDAWRAASLLRFVLALCDRFYYWQKYGTTISPSEQHIITKASPELANLKQVLDAIATLRAREDDADACGGPIDLPLEDLQTLIMALNRHVRTGITNLRQLGGTFQILGRPEPFLKPAQNLLTVRLSMRASSPHLVLGTLLSQRRPERGGPEDVPNNR